MAMFKSLLRTNPASLCDSLSTIRGNPLKSVSSSSCSWEKKKTKGNIFIIQQSYVFTNNNYTDRYQASNLSLNFYSELLLFIHPLISEGDKVLISLYNHPLNQMFKLQE